MQLGNSKTDAVINITPLIDILLVLLITFMVLPSKTHGLKSDVPQPPNETQPAVTNPLDVVLLIHQDHSIEINSQPVVFADLHQKLTSIFAARPNGVLFVDGSGELEFAEVAAVIDVAKGAGIDRIGLLTDKRRETTASR